MPSPVTQYVPYQKLTSPPLRPPAGGYQGITKMNMLTAREKIMALVHALNSVLGISRRARLRRRIRRPKVVAKKNTFAGYDSRSTTR